MNRHVSAIAGRLSLRPPQRRSLEILDRIVEIVPPRKDADLAGALAALRAELPGVSDFEREFPSFCFALATGVGKTRLMGAFISYLHLAHGLNNFFVLAPNLTIYNKLIADFTPNTPKYVFKGIAEFAVNAPVVVTGDNYESGAATRTSWLPGVDFGVCINIFNISKLNSEVRGGKAPRIKRLAECIGESYFDYLAGLPDLVLIMDESHRYRASAGVRAINELRPVLGLELTATPFVEASKGPVFFKNVAYDYPLAKAMEDGFVKEPAVVTRKGFDPSGMSAEDIERLKLEDGVRLHESVKVELETYGRETGSAIVKPFLLVIARDTTHAGQLLALIQSEAFFEGRYKDKVIQVDSSRTGEAEDEMVERLLKVEHNDEPTEIVIHVNMLKEGWDVTNLYTIVPLRAANARTLIEQSIGRGLRLPYGHRTGVAAVDRLNIVAHDRFQEIVDEARRPDSTIRLQTLVLTGDQIEGQSATLVVQPKLESMLGFEPEQISSSTLVAKATEPPLFARKEEREVAQLAFQAIARMADHPENLPSASWLERPEIRASLASEIGAQYQPMQTVIGGAGPDIAAVLAKVAETVAKQTIDIPRILVVPKGEVRSGFKPFTLSLDTLRYPKVAEELWAQYLRTNDGEMLAVGKGSIEERRLEDYVVAGLVDFDDVSYDDQADLLYELAGQVVRHFKSYLAEDDIGKVLQCHQREIARFVHAQMLDHAWEETVDYDVLVKKGFTELRRAAYKVAAGEPVLAFHQAPADKTNMAKYVFGGFRRCLYEVQRFQSDTERRLAVILDRDTLRWFKPLKGQFQIFYRADHAEHEYVPDFVAEDERAIYMLETKASNEIGTDEVRLKKEAAVRWCQHASEHASGYGGKPWRYALIPHDRVAENMTLTELADEPG